eukprot:scaffold8001_cov125-Isochrysis_galbana.AAC.5
MIRCRRLWSRCEHLHRSLIKQQGCDRRRLGKNRRQTGVRLEVRAGGLKRVKSRVVIPAPDTPSMHLRSCAHGLGLGLRRSRGQNGQRGQLDYDPDPRLSLRLDSPFRAARTSTARGPEDDKYRCTGEVGAGKGRQS